MLETNVKLSSGDLARLVDEMAPVLDNLEVRSVWRDGPDVYGFYLVAGDQDQGNQGERKEPSRVVLEVSLNRDTGRLVTCPAGRVDKQTLKERKRDHSHSLDLLRRHLEGARLTKITAVEGERIALIDFDARRPDGLESIAAPRLAVELTGRRTNLVLMDEHNKIVTVHNHGRGQGGRDLVANETYLVPELRGQPGEASELTSQRDEGPLGLNEAVARQLREEEGAAELQSRRGRLRQHAKKGLKRLRSRLAKLEREVEEARNADRFQREGELLKTYASQIPKGATRFKAVDHFEDPPIERELTLDPKQNPMDQAAALFKRAKKLRRGLVNMETRLGQSEADAEDVEELIEELDLLKDADEDDAETIKDLNRIEQKLSQLGCLPKQKASKPKEQRNQGPRQFTSQDGLTILVGRSNSENDKLSLQIARGNDIFLHVRGSPGSHVIIRKPKEKSVPLDTLLDAAALAVHYSKQRGNTHADVSYTPAKYVRKPRGAKPGLVQISNEKVLRPGGDPERLQRLLSSLEKKDHS